MSKGVLDRDEDHVQRYDVCRRTPSCLRIASNGRRAILQEGLLLPPRSRRGGAWLFSAILCVGTVRNSYVVVATMVIRIIVKDVDDGVSPLLGALASRLGNSSHGHRAVEVSS